LWAWIENNFGNALMAEGKNTPGDKAIPLLDQAMQAYQNALQVNTKANSPKEWATTQLNLGRVLTAEGERASGEKALALFSQAITAYQNALEIATKADLPQGWAATQVALGDALLDQAGCSSGAEADALFNRATQAYQNALEVFTRDNVPRSWAGGHLGLSIASLDTARFDMCLQHLGQISDDLLPPRQVLSSDAIRFLCQWGAGNKSAALETEKTLLSKAADATVFYGDSAAIASMLSNSPAFATDRASWIAFLNSFHTGDSAGMTAALRQLEPILQQ
jgi:tetratricopeptide (TPR) repeat protein